MTALKREVYGSEEVKMRDERKKVIRINDRIKLHGEIYPHVWRKVLAIFPV